MSLKVTMHYTGSDGNSRKLQNRYDYPLLSYDACAANVTVTV